MSDLSGFHGLRGACMTVRAWCHQGLSAIAQLQVYPEIEERWGSTLQGWYDQFTALDREADWHLRATAAGLYSYDAVTDLVDRAHRATTEFTRAVTPGEELTEMEIERSVPIGQHRLPPLPYPYDALEPYIDEKTMRLHHDKHHLSYVNGLNTAETMMAQAREQNDYHLIKNWEREAAFNGAGHYLHTIFWDIMSPNGGGEPTGALADQINHDFGSFQQFKQHFSAAAENVEGGGWALLVWSPRSHHLEILQAEKHQNLSQWDVIPLLVLDVWEHAYYLKYNNERKPYIEAWWNIVNWEQVAERYDKARQLMWEPF